MAMRKFGGFKPTQLEANGYRVRAYPSGESFLAEFTDNQPGVLIVDVRMPGMSGFETAQLMLARSPSIRVVILTANIQESSRQVAASLRLNFVAKPATEASLTQALDHLLGAA